LSYRHSLCSLTIPLDPKDHLSAIVPLEQSPGVV
jgi:hypothetical protein